MAGLKTKEEYTGLAQAVSLSIALLKKCKANSWGELQTAMEASDPLAVKGLKAVDLSAEQLSLIAEFQAEIALVRITPPVIPAICTECGRYILVSDTVPTKCMVTASCTGKPAKVAAATASKDPVVVPAPIVAAAAPLAAVEEAPEVAVEASPAEPEEPASEIGEAQEPAEEPAPVVEHDAEDEIAPVDFFEEKIVFAPADELF